MKRHARLILAVVFLAIFVPVLFVKGVIGKYFLQFGVTISAAVMLSLLEALTLAPMLKNEDYSGQSMTGTATPSCIDPDKSSMRRRLFVNDRGEEIGCKLFDYSGGGLSFSGVLPYGRQ